MTTPRRVHLYYFTNWARELITADEHLRLLPQMDMRQWTTDPNDPQLLRMARLDADYDGDWLKAVRAVSHPALEVVSVQLLGVPGVLKFLENFARRTERQDEHWLIFFGRRLEQLGPALGRTLKLFTTLGGKIFFWSWDNLSRDLKNYASDIGPYLTVLLHDEQPLLPAVAAALPQNCLERHLSGVANTVPFSVPFPEQVEERIVFLGSKMGVTPNRRQQFEALSAHFKDRFRAIYDYSVPVDERPQLQRYKVNLCPEGRCFTPPEMAGTHTDRPFWAGCFGQVPVIEDSRYGGRLEDLTQQGLVLRYPYGGGPKLIEACERALQTSDAERRRIYEHFNRHQTMSPIIGEMIARARR